jgi:hypothetical protein
LITKLKDELRDKKQEVTDLNQKLFKIVERGVTSEEYTITPWNELFTS